MEATVVREFKGCADGELHPRTFKVGETVTGSLARTMTDAGFAHAQKKTAVKATGPDKNRMTIPDLNRDSGASQPDRASRKTKSKRSGVTDK